MKPVRFVKMHGAGNDFVLVDDRDGDFPCEHRLIAAMGEFLIVSEAKEKSGTFLTVNEALELNRDIYAIPYPLSDEKSGCNLLIQEGAQILSSYEEVSALTKRFDKASETSLY